MVKDDNLVDITTRSGFNLKDNGSHISGGVRYSDLLGYGELMSSYGELKWMLAGLKHQMSLVDYQVALIARHSPDTAPYIEDLDRESSLAHTYREVIETFAKETLKSLEGFKDSVNPEIRNNAEVRRTLRRLEKICALALRENLMEIIRDTSIATLDAE